MKQYIKMMLFVILLGTIVSGLLVGMDMFTKDRIARNQEALVKSSILDAYNIGYNFSTIFDVFEDNVTEVIVDNQTFYIDNETNQVSYIFEGSGVWGPIKAIMTLESDFKTIVGITILEQEETPGLGGVLAEKPYLDTYVGTILAESSPYIIIRHGSGENLDNEVDAITG
ncbi:MAG: FMN-binding protein, partial [Acholeplasma sp.]|nr:FMN-binding protein [Acholeplasma sp.]